MATGKIGEIGKAPWNDPAREAEFDPVACTLRELDEEIKATTGARKAFLVGVKHARVIFLAAGAISSQH